jgi:cysteine desulfurase
VMGIQSLSLALKDLVKVDVKGNEDQRVKLETFLAQELNGPGGIISGKGKFRNSNTIYFYLNGLSSDIALALFDQHGLQISAGSACSSGTANASVLLTHLGFKDQAKNGLRISFNFELSDEDREDIQGRIAVVLKKIKES